MFKSIVLAGLASFFLAGGAAAQSCTAYPNSLSNGSTADANQVMANFSCAALLGSAHFTSYVDLGAPPEKLSLNSGSLGFNRAVWSGAIYNSSAYAYQFQHSGSTSPTADYLGLQVYAPTGSAVTNNALAVNGVGNVGIATPSPISTLDM